MNRKLVLSIVPALLLLSSCQAPSINHQNNDELDGIIEDTLAHEEIFGKTEFNYQPNIYKEDESTTVTIPTVGIQTKIDKGEDDEEDKISIRFVAAIDANDGLDNISAVWTRIMYKADGSVYKESATKESTKAYTGLASSSDDDDVLTIDEFNEEHSTSYTHFVVYTMLNIPLTTYCNYFLDACVTVDDVTSKVVATTVDQKTQYSFDYNAHADWSYYIRNAVYPVDNGDGTVTYGIYPQTVLEDSDGLYDILNSSAVLQTNGWYLYNDEYYASVSGNPNPNLSFTVAFKNGSSIVKGTTYWFKCEPITWKILTSDNGEYFLLAEELLDNCNYYYYESTNGTRTINGDTIYNDNYEYSEIRAWLNGLDGSEYCEYDSYFNYTNKGFLQRAFVLNDSNVLETEVDNSASTTASNSNPNVNNTTDKVFLLSYKDLITTAYGFSSDKEAMGDTSKRCSITTDWDRANYAQYSSDGRGYYWTRSASYSDEHRWASIVRYSGKIESDYVRPSNAGTYSIRPAIKITIG